MQDSDRNDSLRSNSSYKIREFEWFEVETKIRLFVQRLIEPTLKQIHEDRVVVDQISAFIKQNLKEVAMLKDIVLDQGAGVPIFNEFKQKFIELELNMDKQKIEQQEQVKVINRRMDNINNDIEKVQEIANTIVNAKIKLEEEQKNQAIMNEEFRQSMEQLLQNLSNEITENFSHNQKQQNSFEQQITNMKQTLTEIVNSAKSEAQKLGQLQEQYLSINKLQLQQISNLSSIEHKFKQIEQIQQQLKFLEQQIDKQNNDIKLIESFLILYSPLYIQSQISETLFNCLPITTINKMSGYEKNKLELYDKKILEFNGQLNIQELIDQASIIIEEITKRNAKIIQQLKIKALESSQSSDLNNSDSENEASKSDKTSKAINSSINSPKKKNLNQFDLQYNEQQIVQIHDEINEKMKNMDQKVAQIVKDLQLSYIELDQQNGLFKFDIQTQIQKQFQKISAQIKSIDEKQQSQIMNNNNNVNESLIDKNERKVIQTILHYLVLITHLLIQDEIDRQGIQLVGARETGIDEGITYTNNQKKVNSIFLQNDCLSCSGQPIQLLQQFKLACLAYHPSDISVDGKTYKRDQLLEVCTQLLKQAKTEFTDINKNITNNQLIQPILQVYQSNKNQRSSSIPSSIAINNTNRIKKYRKLAPMTNLHDL